MRSVITRIREEARGEISVEYGLIIAIIAIICIGILLLSNNGGSGNIRNLTMP